MLGLVLLCQTSALAHYNMVLPNRASARKGDEVTFTYQWGHPFEHELFDAPSPESVFVLEPNGKKTDLIKTLEKVATLSADKKEVTAYRWKFTPNDRGDYVFFLTAPPIWLEEEEEFLQDTVKVVLHVQRQKGWDQCAGLDLELTPLTRPYGLQAGMVFQAAIRATKPLAGALVEIEHYNAQPPRELPADEQITRTVKSDPQGIATCTLPEPGWWCLAAQGPDAKKLRNGKEYCVRQRAIYWVYVDEKIASRAGK
jgi:cobalt/nickel transport protein